MLPQWFVLDADRAGFSDMFLQKLIQIPLAIAVIEHNTNWFVSQTRSQQWRHINVIQTSQVFRFGTKFFFRIFRDARS